MAASKSFSQNRRQWPQRHLRVPNAPVLSLTYSTDRQSERRAEQTDVPAVSGPLRLPETSKKHFAREGRGDRSSLRQSSPNGCLPSIKCRRCQSAGWVWSKMAPVMSQGGICLCRALVLFLFIIIHSALRGKKIAKHTDRSCGSSDRRS